MITHYFLIQFIIDEQNTKEEDFSYLRVRMINTHFAQIMHNLITPKLRKPHGACPCSEHYVSSCRVVSESFARPNGHDQDQAQRHT